MGVNRGTTPGVFLFETSCSFSRCTFRQPPLRWEMSSQTGSPKMALYSLTENALSPFHAEQHILGSALKVVMKQAERVSLMSSSIFPSISLFSSWNISKTLMFRSAHTDMVLLITFLKAGQSVYPRKVIKSRAHQIRVPFAFARPSNVSAASSKRPGSRESESDSTIIQL